MKFLNISKILFALVLSSTAIAIACNSSSTCPEDSPCCNQYGECGTGAHCLGGCNIKASYNMSACMPMPRMFNFTSTFENTDDLLDLTTYLGNASEGDWVYSGYIDTNDDALLLEMPNHTAGTVISSTKYLWYGKVSATLKTSHDGGVVTAFILFSDVQDELDWEFVGYNLTAPQTNYYFQGIENYTNVHDVSSSDTFANYHTYEFDWSEDRIKWSIDGQVLRTLNKDDTYNSTSKKYMYPQSPARIQFSLWPAGDTSNAEGTIEWSGGPINWDSSDIKDYGYYYAYLKNVTVETYGLPDDVKLVGSDNPDNLHAFEYNSTNGYEDDIFLTNATTWLGSDDASGLDPDNESTKSKSSSSSSSSSSKSSSKTSTNSSSTSTSTSDSDSNSGSDSGNDSGSSETSSATYAANQFVQDSGDGSSTSASSQNIAHKPEGIIGITGTLALAMYMVFF